MARLSETSAASNSVIGFHICSVETEFSAIDSGTMLLQTCTRRLAARSRPVNNMPLRAKILDPAMNGERTRKVRFTPLSYPS